MLQSGTHLLLLKSCLELQELRKRGWNRVKYTIVKAVQLLHYLSVLLQIKYLTLEKCPFLLTCFEFSKFCSKTKIHLLREFAQMFHPWLGNFK